MFASLPSDIRSDASWSPNAMDVVARPIDQDAIAEYLSSPEARQFPDEVS